MSHLRRLGVVYFALLVTLFATPCAAHNGSKDLATTVRDLGLGGAFVATEPAVGSLQGNPAALAFLEGPELYVDLRFLQAQVEYSGLLEAQGNQTHFLIPNAGYVEPLSDKLAWGLGAFTLTTIGYSVGDFKLDRIFPGIPQGLTGSASTRIRYLTLTPGIAYRLSDDTAVGASLNYSSGETDEEAASQFADSIGFRLYGLRGEGYSVRLGLYHRADDTTFGAYWRSRSHLDVGGGSVETGPLFPTPSQVIHDVKVTGGDFPEEYGLGLGQRLNPRWKLYAEYRHYNWSKVRKVITIELPGSDPIPNPQYWKDQNVYILAAEYQPDCTDREVWSFGLNFAKAPVPRKYLSPQYPAVTEWHYTAGYQRELSDGLVLNTSLVYTAPNSLTTSADSPFNGVFGGGEPYRAGSESLQFGLGLTWKLGRRSARPDIDTPSACPDCIDEIVPAPVAVDAESNQTYAALLGSPQH